MNILRRTLFSLTLFCLVLNSFATWSIIIVDPGTKEIGIAGASCTPSVYGIGAIVPGKGAIVVQAMSNPLARGKGVEMIMQDASAADILKALMNEDYEPEEQQYAIICLSDPTKPATYTGKENPDFNGALTANGVSIQGNTLASAEELQALLDAVLKARKDSLSMQETLMLALEAGAKLGGDKRCGELKASSAFIITSLPDADLRKPSVKLVVYGDDENVSAIERLRKKFDKWKKEN